MKKKGKERAKKALFDVIDDVDNSREPECTATEKLRAIAVAVRVLEKL